MASKPVGKKDNCGKDILAQPRPGVKKLNPIRPVPMRGEDPCEACDPCASHTSGYGFVVCVNGRMVVITPPAGGHWVPFFNASGVPDWVNIAQLIEEDRPALLKKKKGKE